MRVAGAARHAAPPVPHVRRHPAPRVLAALAALARYPDLAGDVPLDFVQNKERKIRVDDLMPVDWPADRELEWSPPGHGDIYTALVTSGMLETLLEHGYEYAFQSNSDNL